VGLDLDCLLNDLVDTFIRELVVDVLVKKTSKIGVHAFIARDQFIRECKAWHEPSLLKPEDCAEAAREEDSLDSCEGYHTLCEVIR